MPTSDPRVDLWTRRVMHFLTHSAPGAIFDVLAVWLGYDLLAPLYHLPLANPLHAAGLLLVLAILRRQK